MAVSERHRGLARQDAHRGPRDEPPLSSEDDSISAQTLIGVRHVREMFRPARTLVTGAVMASRSAGRRNRHQQCVESHGRRQSEDHSVLRPRVGFRPRTGIQSGAGRGPCSEQDVYRHGGLRGSRPIASTGSRSRSIPSVRAADCRQPRPRRSSSTRTRRGAVERIWMTLGFLRAATTNNATGQVADDGRQEARHADVHWTEQREGQRVSSTIWNMVEKVETLIDNPMLGAHAFRGELHRLQGLRRREILDQDRAEAKGGFPTPRSDGDRCESQCTVGYPASSRGAGGAGARAADSRPPPHHRNWRTVARHLIFPRMRRSRSTSRTTSSSSKGRRAKPRATAIIDEAKTAHPEQADQDMSSTRTAHFDHPGGLRTFVAEGATIITHQINKPYYEKIFSLPHTLSPDKLAEAKKKLSIET